MLKNTDQVFIRDLTLEMSIGIYDHEKAKPQSVIINVVIDVESNLENPPSSINDVVSYENITNQIEDLAKSKHFDLVETFAEDIAKICLSERKAFSASIKIEKPDIIHNTKSVGVEIRRSK
ncbi:MAG: FolB domain-containing protein [Alphaproteobacteria bacterium]|nr:FolB domain-containing protein [Alphaproteobacteria bacterium]